MIILSLANDSPELWSAIVSSVIQAIGTISAALIATLFAKNVVENIKPRSYSDNPKNIYTVLKKARSDIFIITAVGNKLLKTTEKVIEQKLKSGVYVRYLMLDVPRFHEMEVFLHGTNAKSEAIFYDAIAILVRLKRKYPNRLEVRFFANHMTASYIGVDTCLSSTHDHTLLSPLIQVMPYQYHTHAENSAILSFYEKSYKDFYDLASFSMKDMWENASARLKKVRN